MHLSDQSMQSKLGFVREIAYDNASILKWIVSISLFISFRFKITLYEPSFFSLTKMLETICPSTSCTKLITLLSIRLLISVSTTSFSSAKSNLRKSN